MPVRTECSEQRRNQGRFVDRTRMRLVEPALQPAKREPDAPLAVVQRGSAVSSSASRRSMWRA